MAQCAAVPTGLAFFLLLMLPGEYLVCPAADELTEAIKPFPAVQIGDIDSIASGGVIYFLSLTPFINPCHCLDC
jgi:hypothetical protein